jgi:malonyl-ACP decarboxylase
VPVAVTGIGVVTPVGTGVDTFTRALQQTSRGVVTDGVMRLPTVDPVAGITSRGASRDVVSNAGRVLRRAPYPVLVSACAALEAWQQAGLLDDTPYAPEDVSLVVGGSNLNQRGTWDLAAAYASRLEFVPPSHGLHFMDTDHLAVISELLSVRGEGVTIGAASASGTAALLHGYRQVAGGRAGACIVVGAMTDLSPLEWHSLLNMGAMSPDGVCRPFDRDRRGFVYGHSSACLILESLDEARARGRQILGVIRGGAQCLDANRSSDPRCDGEVRAMRLALADAGVEAADVDYVNTHGTGSIVGDAVEAEALAEVFGDRLPDVWINATKALTGHSLTAAGVVEAAAVMLQMAGGFLHGNPSLDNPIGPGRWVPAAGSQATCRLALSNSFGFGGINTAVVIEREAGSVTA